MSGALASSTNSESAAPAPIELAEDLEDGEIDDDEDETPQENAALEKQHNNDDEVQFVGIEPSSNKNDDDIVFMGIVKTSATGNTLPTANLEQPSKSKKPRPLEDDHAVSIENAIANALKKKGIEPPMPKMLNAHTGEAGDAPNAATISDGAAESGGAQQQSRNSRRRKRKKEREREQKKDKEQQKTARLAPTEEPSGDASDDMDEYEMMNVRGGSPPPGGIPLTNPSAPPRFPPDWVGPNDPTSYDSPPDNNYSSYDSYSEDENGAGSSSHQRRRQRKDGRSSRKRRDRDSDRRHDNGNSSKRSRRDSGGNGGSGGAADEKPREPRKLELCKFYLMDCCAKRDKCSYMHKEFPCKYYYLGMDCFAGEDCLFHHGEPLNEQLRNILLKHMETAPKEILGDFKRMPREQAMVQMTRRHEELCSKYGMENTWTSIASAGVSRRHDHPAGQLMTQQQTPNICNPLQQTPGQTQAIPSLLDMVINPPINMIHESSKTDKKRKSRWADKNSAGKHVNANATTTTATAVSAVPAASAAPAALAAPLASPAPAASAAPAAAEATVAPPAAAATASTASTSSTVATTATAATTLPPHLDLVNLANVLSEDQMAKLTQLGITNLDQILQVPFGKLTEVGLTLVEIGDMQRQLATLSKKFEEAKATETKCSDKSGTTEVTQTSSSNSNSNSNGFIMVDYTQYLKDAHVNFDRNDPLDDEEEEEQLVIDDGNESENEISTNKNVSSQSQEEDDVPKPSVFDLPSFISMLNTSTTTAEPSSSASATKKEPSETTKKSETKTSSNADSTNTIFSKLLFGDKQGDPEARAAFYRDIIRNPFKAHSGDAENENSNSGGTDYLYGQHDSRSLTPTPTGASNTPEPGSQSPKPLQDVKPSLYERSTIYDFDPVKDKELAANKADKDMRTKIGADRDIDMRLPFEPIMHYTPATEVDAAIFSHRPVCWELEEVDVDPPRYTELRQAEPNKRDPRMRRIFGLPELSYSQIEESERKSSNCISSPESVYMSPSARDTTPTSPPPLSATVLKLPAMNVPPPSLPTSNKEIGSLTGVRTDPRRDPRRAANANAGNSATSLAPTLAANSQSSGAGLTQFAEIRNLLQISNWYKNLGSNNKMLINQELSTVSAELKKFHQLKLPNKIFDVSFIISNRTLQQIFGQLHIYIDENGQVVHLPDDGPTGCSVNSGVAGNSNNAPNIPLILPNMSQPPPNLAQLLRQPPPNLCGPLGSTILQMSLPPFNQPPPNRPSLLGLPPNGGVNNAMLVGNNGINNPFNPFGGGVGNGAGNGGAGVGNVPNIGNVGNMGNMGGGGGGNMLNMGGNMGGNMNMPFNGPAMNVGNGGGPPGLYKNFGSGGNGGNRHFRNQRGHRNRNNMI